MLFFCSVFTFFFVFVFFFCVCFLKHSLSQNCVFYRKEMESFMMISLMMSTKIICCVMAWLYFGVWFVFLVCLVVGWLISGLAFLYMCGAFVLKSKHDKKKRIWATFLYFVLYDYDAWQLKSWPLGLFCYWHWHNSLLLFGIFIYIYMLKFLLICFF